MFTWENGELTVERYYEIKYHVDDSKSLEEWEKIITDTFAESVAAHQIADVEVGCFLSSGVDSRTILDMNGAEKLLGKGDMLFYPQGYQKPARLQGAFVSDDEINKVIDYTVSQQKAQYDEKFNTTDSATQMHNDGDSEEEYDDPLYNDIREFVIRSGKASASLLQRKYKLGYNRAARIMDLLEERGIVGPQNGSKPREVLVKLEEKGDE